MLRTLLGKLNNVIKMEGKQTSPCSATSQQASVDRSMQFLRYTVGISILFIILLCVISLAQGIGAFVILQNLASVASVIAPLVTLML